MTAADVKRIARSTQETKSEFNEIDLDQVFTPDYYLLNCPAQGVSSYGQRVGNTITAQSLEIRGGVSAVPNGTACTSFALVVIQDKEPDGAVPTMGSVFEIFSASGEDPLFSLRNPKYMERYKILHREDHTISPIYGTDAGKAPVGGTPSQMTYHIYLDLTKKLTAAERQIKFINTGGTITSMGSNAIYLLILPSNQARFGETLSANAPMHYAQTKFNYKDA